MTPTAPNCAGRALVTILHAINRPHRYLCHAADGISRENPLEAVRRLGELATELEQFGDVAAETPTG